MPEISKTYNPFEVEDKIYQRWKASGFFNPDKLPGPTKKQAYSIAMPPPNVTGDLHLGHATGLTIQDLLTRFKRMQGYKTLWLAGTDHAGIATQIMVERMIAKEGLNRHSLGRAKFLNRVWAWKKEYGDLITKQVRKLGASCDWSRERFTMDPQFSKAVKEAFVKLYNQGLIYQGERIINWCPRCQTALSDLEVNFQEEKGKLWFIKYPLVAKGKTKKYITIATTRPETMLGDTAVAVNPKDKRYQKLVGQKVKLPITNRIVPIIADQSVDPAFGTGAVKVTPAHNSKDWEIGQAHKLKEITIINAIGRLTEAAGRFKDLTISQAREEIINLLQKQQLLAKTEEYTHSVGHCSRCGKTIEALISKQWFVKIKPLAKQAISAVTRGQIEIVPKRFIKVYLNWMTNIKDWCISRQLWWGHQLPVWHCGNKETTTMPKMGFYEKVVPQVFRGKTKTYRLRDHHLNLGDRVVFENSQAGVIFGYGVITDIKKTKVGQISLNDKAHGATYSKVEELISAFKKHYPDRRVTKDTDAWIYAYDFKPAKETKGCGEIIVTVIKPTQCPKCKNKNLTQIEDTLDTWFSSGLWTFATLGWPAETEDLKKFHPTSVMVTGWDLIFFWVARMIMMSLYLTDQIPFKKVYFHGLVLDKDGKKMSKSKGTGVDPQEMSERYGTDALRMSLVIGMAPGQDFRLYEHKIAGYRNFANKLWNIFRFVLSQKQEGPEKFVLKNSADQWIVSRLNRLIEETTSHLEKFEFSQSGEKIYEFVWHELADWYLEIAKSEINLPVLNYLLANILKLLHPFMPFITEELWGILKDEKDDKDLLMTSDWPKADRKLINLKAEKEIKKLREVVVQVRNLKAKAEPEKIKGLLAKKKLSLWQKKVTENLF